MYRKNLFFISYLTVFCFFNLLAAVEFEFKGYERINEPNTKEQAQALQDRVAKAEQDIDFKKLVDQKKQYDDYINIVEQRKLQNLTPEAQYALLDNVTKLERELRPRLGELEAYENAKKFLNKDEVQKLLRQTTGELAQIAEVPVVAIAPATSPPIVQENISVLARIAQKFSAWVKRVRTRIAQFLSVGDMAQVAKEIESAHNPVDPEIKQYREVIDRMASAVSKADETIQQLEQIFRSGNLGDLTVQNTVIAQEHVLDLVVLLLEERLKDLQNTAINSAVEEDQSLNRDIIKAAQQTAIEPDAALIGIGTNAELAAQKSVQEIIQARLVTIKNLKQRIADFKNREQELQSSLNQPPG